MKISLHQLLATRRQPDLRIGYAGITINRAVQGIEANVNCLHKRRPEAAFVLLGLYSVPDTPIMGPWTAESSTRSRSVNSSISWHAGATSPLNGTNMNSIGTKTIGREWVRHPTIINELCCKIPLGSGCCLKIYTTFDRETHLCRMSGRDSIKIVAAQMNSLKPIRPAHTHIKRLPTWQKNFDNHLRKILVDLGNSMMCACGAPRVIRKNPRTNENFLGCSKFDPTARTHCVTDSIRVLV